MSNRILLLSTKFEDVTGISYGYRISDDFGSDYNNESEEPIEDDLELLTYVKNVYAKDSVEILDFMREHEKGITINNTYYDYDQVRSLLED